MSAISVYLEENISKIGEYGDNYGNSIKYRIEIRRKNSNNE